MNSKVFCSTMHIYNKIRLNTLAVSFIQGVKKVPDPKQNYIGLMTEG